MGRTDQVDTGRAEWIPGALEHRVIRGRDMTPALRRGLPTNPLSTQRTVTGRDTT